MHPTLLATLLALHRLGLRAYPRHFRAIFADEMHTVFAEALAEAARHGAWPVAVFLAREWALAPGAVASEHWQTLRQQAAAGGAIQTEAGMATGTLARGVAASVVTLLVLAPFAILLWWLFGRALNLGLLLPGLLCLTPLVCAWAWALTPAARRARPTVWLGLGLVCSGGLAAPTALLVGHRLDGWPTALRMMMALLPAVALVVSAMLLAVSLEAWPHDGARRPGRVAAGLALAVLLVVMVFGNLYWLLVWDLTDDPLGFLWLIPEALGAVFAGVALATGLPGRKKWAGLYGVLLLSGLAGLVAHTQTIDFRALTTARGQEVARAIEAFHARTGDYPAAIGDLGVGYRLRRLTPVIISGQDWCYQSNGDAYLLGYVDRAHWSSPELFGHLAAEAGTLTGAAPLCAAEIEALRQPRPPAATWAWPFGGQLPAGLAPGHSRAEVTRTVTEVWHRDSCAPAAATSAGYGLTDLLWTGSRDVKQATVIVVRYVWQAGARQWIVSSAAFAKQDELYPLYDRCSSLDLSALASAAP